MNKGDPTPGRLQRAMWRLLLAHIPRRCSTNHELATRFKMWQHGEYVTLLECVESQAKTILPSGGPNIMQRAKRARRMSQNGAHRKAVMSLRGEMCHLTEKQELEFAQLLVPDKPECSDQPLRRAKTDCPAAVNGSAGDHDRNGAPEPELHPAMRGVRFARPTGPGKSGFRLEHLSGMLCLFWEPVQVLWTHRQF